MGSVFELQTRGSDSSKNDGMADPAYFLESTLNKRGNDYVSPKQT